MNERISLICKSVQYYSLGDEDAFFEWIKNIPSIKKTDGTYDELYLFLSNNTIPDRDLREIIRLFYRYKIDMKQLAVFLNNENKEWFYCNPKGYWHKKVFGLDSDKCIKNKK